MIKFLTRYVIETTHFSEQQIRDIIKRDLPEFHLRKRPTKKKYQEVPFSSIEDMVKYQLKKEEKDGRPELA